MAGMWPAFRGMRAGGCYFPRFSIYCHMNGCRTGPALRRFLRSGVAYFYMQEQNEWFKKKRGG